jgi:D-3-phosphoglycerate dehydrogenase
VPTAARQWHGPAGSPPRRHDPHAEPPVARGIRVFHTRRFGVDYDTVDIPACTRRVVVVGVTNGGNDLSVAEHTLLLLAVARWTIEMGASVRAGKWMLRDDRPMGELTGRIIPVVGYGRTGTRVARLCAAFGMKVMVCDPFFPVPRVAVDGFALGHRHRGDVAED